MRVTARLATCQTCRGPILAALCDGIETRCEPVPLSRRGELLAALAGVATYRLDTDRRLHANDCWRIAADAPLPGDHRLAAHRCDRPIPTDWIDMKETA